MAAVNAISITAFFLMYSKNFTITFLSQMMIQIVLSIAASNIYTVNNKSDFADNSPIVKHIIVLSISHTGKIQKNLKFLMNVPLAITCSLPDAGREF